MSFSSDYRIYLPVAQVRSTSYISSNQWCTYRKKPLTACIWNINWSSDYYCTGNVTADNHPSLADDFCH